MYVGTVFLSLLMKMLPHSLVTERWSIQKRLTPAVTTVLPTADEGGGHAAVAVYSLCLFIYTICDNRLVCCVLVYIAVRMFYVRTVPISRMFQKIREIGTVRTSGISMLCVPIYIYIYLSGCSMFILYWFPGCSNLREMGTVGTVNIRTNLGN